MNSGRVRTVEHIGGAMTDRKATLNCAIWVSVAFIVAACQSDVPSRQSLSTDLLPGVERKGNCDGALHAAQCWLALDNKSECYVWQEEPVAAGLAVTWSGDCSHGRAEGKGTLKIVWRNHWHGGAESVQDGEMAGGKKTGFWELHHPYVTERGEYERGRRVGAWEISAPNGWTVTERYMTWGPSLE